MKMRLFLLSLLASTFAFAEDIKELSPTVVTATRYATNSFDLPLSIDAITGSEIRDARTGANLSEIAPRIPGVVINYRSTAAQELAISSRGFGARSQFGVKGIRIYADGIPLNSADGQGQAGSINLDTLGQIEFLRGPFSALYGNSSGGVVQAFTRDGAKDPTLTVGVSSGSWHTNKQSITAEGQAGPINYILNTYQYVSDGYRDFSQYRKDNFNGKISYQIRPDTKFTFVGNYMDQPYTNDPQALTPAQYASNSRAQGTNTAVSLTASQLNARLYRVNSYSGIVIDHDLSEKDSLRLMAYDGSRSNLQYLTTGAASEIIRDTEGFDFRWTRKDLFLDRPLNFTAGLSYDSMEDLRSRYTYTAPGVYSPLGTKVNSDRREKQTAFSMDEYLQASYEPTDKILVIAGLRHSRVNIKNTDLWLGETTTNTKTKVTTSTPIDSSGQVTYTNTSPVAGVTFKLTPILNIYANYGRGFETPTFAETTYSSALLGTGPNLSMVPMKSKNYEVGLKAFVTSNTRINIALFKVDTKNEIVTVANSGSQNQYDSIANTERKGVEFSLDSRLPYNFNFYQTYTYTDSEFKNSFNTTVGDLVSAGNKLSGVYKNTAYTELSWKYPALNFSSAVENIYYSDVNGYDSNDSARKADAYSIVNLRASLKQSLNNWNFTEFARADNVFDEKYVGNVRVNNAATFEPGAPRNYTVGVTSSYTFK
jgi:iron complex outermembrane receptor protein